MLRRIRSAALIMLFSERDDLVQVSGHVTVSGFDPPVPGPALAVARVAAAVQLCFRQNCVDADVPGSRRNSECHAAGSDLCRAFYSERSRATAMLHLYPGLVYHLRAAPSSSEKTSSGFFTYARASMMMPQLSGVASKALIVGDKILDCSGVRQFFMPPAFFVQGNL